MTENYLDILVKRREGYLTEQSIIRKKLLEIDTAIKVLTEIDQSVSELNNKSETNNITPLLPLLDFKWDRRKPFKVRVKELLTKNNRFSSTEELTTIAQTFEPNIDFKYLQGKISDGLSTLKKINPELGLILIKLDGTNKSAIWGYSEWMDNDYDIKTEYLPNLKNENG